MILKNIKIFIKQLSKNKLYSLVTIFGFSVSLMFIVLLSAYLKQETSVDKFHEKKDRLFRLVNEDDSSFGAITGRKLADALPEVESYTRIFDYNQYCTPVNSGSDNKLNAEILMVDSAFFNMFSFKLLEGLPNEVLNAKNSILLTPKFARALFGSISPLGKQIKSSNGLILQVTGIFEEMPENTQFKKYDAIANIRLLPDFMGWKEVLDNNDMCDFTYYVLAKEGTNIIAKEEQALDLLKTDLWTYKDGRVKSFGFEPIAESYFSDKPGNIRQNSKTLITVLLAIVLIILLLAIINYVNLTIAQSGFRNKEIAIRKLMGSSRMALIYEHVTESVMFSFIAAIIGIFLAFLAEPVFNKLLDTHIDLLHYAGPVDLLIVVFAMLVIGIISGLFPSLLLTKLKPVEVVKGSFRTKTKTSYSKVLVSFQFAATIALIVCAITITKQTRYMQNFDMGFKKENIVQIDKAFPKEKRQAFNDILKQIPRVEQVSFVCGTPLSGGNNQSFTYNSKPVSFQEFLVDTAFFSMMGISYTPTGVAWSDNVLWLNKNAVKELGLDPLPKSFKRYDEELPVYGVVEDFHFSDLHQPVGLAMLSPLNDKKWSWNVLVKISGKNIAGSMAQIKSAYSSFTDNDPFDYKFLDSEVDSWYKKEANTSKIITWFSVLTIIISVMGILALVTLFNQLRTKEIGVRKVNGAKISEVMVTLNKDFVKWVAVAFVIATPVAYYAMNKWLENFAYKTTLSWWIFALAGFLALGIALLTVSWQSWRAATRNPVEALRYE
ncbi:FtsX-like permease family protein [uncultured Sunxiuqinia sp.]|uniref:ABC transporter permease n=1 Tax=uncultured Sunxiuqinia sp. TaxID=1573825 RepID=UPI002AA8DC50|nr:FtsX-like permease family protein [uncultured Sunxiuqinia sp.]